MSRNDFEDFGYTSGCPRCDHELKWGPGRTSRPHSERCRSRIMAELAKTDVGRLRLGLAADRMDRSMWDHVSRHEDQKAHAQGENVGEVPIVPDRDPF